jgi:hypothetical protein
MGALAGDEAHVLERFAEKRPNVLLAVDDQAMRRDPPPAEG